MKNKSKGKWLMGLVLVGVAVVGGFLQYSFQRDAQASSGDVILLWDGTSSTIPSGWTCVSCNGGAFQNVFPQAAANYGASVVGSDSVTHTLTFSSATAAAPLAAGGNGTGVSGASHTHVWAAPTVTAENIVPLYKGLLFIAANNPTQIPAGAIGMFDTSSNNLPAGWSYYSALENRYLRGSDVVSSGGAATSSAVTTAAVTSGAAQGTQFDPGKGKAGGTGTAPTHTHTIAAGSALNTQQNNPSYIGVVFAKATANTALPSGLVAFFDAAPPAGWSVLSTTGSVWDGRLIVGSPTFGNVGGVATENNGGSVTWTSSAASGAGIAVKGNGGPVALAGHTHNVTYTIDSLSALPAHRAVIVAKHVVASVAQVHYRWRNDDGVERSSGIVIDGTTGTGTGSSLAMTSASNWYTSYLCNGNTNCFRGQGLLLAKSTNGGASWSSSLVFSQSQGAQFNQTSIAAPNASTIYILGNGVIVGGPVPGVVFFRSTDGGTSWASSSLTSANPTSLSNTSIAAPSPSTVYATYGTWVPSYGVQGVVYLDKSTDGGATWTPTQIDQGSSDIPQPTIAAPNASTVYVAYRKGLGNNTYALTMMHSSDGGATWASSTIDQSTTGFPSIVATDASTVLVSYYSLATHGLMSAKSTDGGATWTISTMDLAIPAYGGSSNMVAASPSQISMVYSNSNTGKITLEQSTDSGASWTASAVGDANPALTTFSIAAGGGALAMVYNPGSFLSLSLVPPFAPGQASFRAAEDTAITNVAMTGTDRLRFEATAANGSGQVRLSIEYATATTGPWTAVGSAGAAWNMSDSQYITDGEPTANIPGGLTDANTTFVPGELHDASAQTGTITLGASNFTEVEYAITPTPAATAGQTYYFRMTNAGNALDSYPVYATAKLAP